MNLWDKFRNSQPIYWLRTHTIDRYHIIDIRGMDGYKWGWIDRDHAMYLACFKLLCDFVEQEDPGIGLRTLADYGIIAGSPEEDAIQSQLVSEREIRAIYDWWKTTRNQEKEACERLLDGVDLSWKKMWKKCEDGNYEFVRTEDPRWDRYSAEHDRLEAKDEEMLMRLMAVRRKLWT